MKRKRDTGEKSVSLLGSFCFDSINDANDIGDSVNYKSKTKKQPSDEGVFHKRIHSLYAKQKCNGDSCNINKNVYCPFFNFHNIHSCYYRHSLFSKKNIE